MRNNLNADNFKYGDLVSVITPTFKRTDALKRAIDSIMAQTYTNLEIIVIDDNAEYPDYREKVKKLIAKYPLVKLLQNDKNLGGALSRNRGVKEAKGKLIAFLDDDDEWREDKIEKQCQLFCEQSNKNLGLVISNHEPFNPDTNIIYQHMHKILATTSHWLVPKEVIEEVGMFEPTPNEQDSILLLKILLAGYAVYNIPEDLVLRHYHDKSSGISGAKLKNTVGTNRLRDLCRLNYNKLDNKKQVANVEHNLSSKLFDIYIYNSKKQEAKKEFHIMLKTAPVAIDTLKAFIKIYFNRIFFMIKNRKNTTRKEIEQ